MPKPHYQQARFLTSAAELSQLPKDSGIEVAFAGRSNCGKSSALNALAQQTNLARTSRTPGRTQLINLFALDEQRRLVDLPGYGFAQVPLAIKLRWQETLAAYLQERESLTGLMLLMDIRHPLKPVDQEMVHWASLSELPCHVLLTKADKLSAQQQQRTLREVRQALTDYPNLSVQLFSAHARIGLEEAFSVLDRWFQLGK